MTKRGDDRFTARLSADANNGPMPGTEIFPTVPVPNSGIPRRDSKIQAENEELRQQLAQLMAQRASGMAVQEDGTILIQDFQLTPTGLVAPDQMSQEAWEQIGLLLFKLEGSIQFLIGDWLVYGADLKYGEVDDIANALGREPETLHQYASVCRKVKLWIRIHNLSYGHHKLVAPMPEDKQAEALAYASENNLSVADFRAWIKEQKNGAPALPDPDEAILKPLASQFKKLMREDRTQAEEYLKRVRQWTDDMLVQLRGQG